MWHQHARQDESPPPVPARRRGRPRGAVVSLERAGLNYDPNDFNLMGHRTFNIGGMTILCRHCQALRFKEEPKGICCKSGKIKDVPKIPAPPEEWLPLYSNDTQVGKNFQGNARMYNQAFNMTSIRTKWIIEGTIGVYLSN